MAAGPFLNSINGGMTVLAVAGAMLYIAARAAIDSAVDGQSSSGRLALGFYATVAAFVIVATAIARPELAVAVILPTSVAAVLLAGGATILFSPPVGSARSATRWGTLVPVSVVLYLTRFHSGNGSTNLFYLLALVLQGGLALSIWNRPHANDQDPGRPPGVAAIISLMLAIILGGLGTWMTAFAVDRVVAARQGTSVPLIAATLLSPLLVLPMIGVSTDLAHRGQSHRALSALIGFILLNLCASLPLIYLTAWSRWAVFSLVNRHHHQPPYDLPIIPITWTAWRLELLLLIATGVLLAPAGARLIRLTKPIGLAMMFVFAAYAVVTILSGVL